MIRLTEHQHKIMESAYHVVLKRKKAYQIFPLIDGYSFITEITNVCFKKDPNMDEEVHNKVSLVKLGHLICSIVIPISKLFFVSSMDYYVTGERKKESIIIEELATFIEPRKGVVVPNAHATQVVALINELNEPIGHGTQTPNKLI